MTNAKLNDIRNSLDFSFTESSRLALRSARDAQLRGDQATKNAILAERRVIEAKRAEAEERLMAASLSTEQVDKLTGDLGAKAKEATKLLDQLRKTAEFLKTLKKVADLATGVLTTVAGIVL